MISSNVHKVLQSLSIFALLLGVFSCGPEVGISDTEIVPEEIIKQEGPSPDDTVLIVDYQGNPVEVRIDYPAEKMIGTLLLLQGWNFPNTDWCDSTSMCTEALERGYAIVCPDMGKSIYSQRVYPETRKDWVKYPTGTWLTDSLIPQLQSLQVFDPDDFNAVVGLSTGARGALLVALDQPDAIHAAVCLSGDYDQAQFPSDNLYRGFFGSKDRFPDRWEGEENPMNRLKLLKASLYLSHGTTDKIVPIQHSRILKEKLDELEIPVTYNEVSGAGHDYTFWNSEVIPIFNFLEKARKNR